MRELVRCLGTGLLLCAMGSAGGFAQGWHHIGKVERVEVFKEGIQDGAELTAGEAKVRITQVSNGIMRVRVSPNGHFPKDFSWAVAETPLNSISSPVRIHDGQNEVKMTAGAVNVLVTKSPLLVTFSDLSGNVLLADEPSLPMAWNGPQVHVWKEMPVDENYYALGDKAGPMNRRNRAFTSWNTDEFGWQESSDPLYKTIPFLIGLRKGVAYGVFFDNTYRSSFDFGKQGRDYFSFGAEGGELNYYFMAGPEPRKVVEEYTTLTGHTPLPPLWSLGYQQCRVITDLHIKKDPNHGYAPYDSGIKSDVFVKNSDGSVFVGKVWPGDSVFPDFTLSRVRNWWGSLYKDFVAMGVAGFWNDMNEPSVFLRADKTMPLDTIHRLDDGTTVDHRAAHNIYGMENARATYEGLLKLQAGERPFVLTRAAYSGAQRYAATWTGDNSSTWNHLKMSTPMLMSMGISGMPLVGDDVGGFAGSPPADLLTRWFEVGALNPIYRDHTAKGTADQEPWVHGPEHEAIRKKYIELRYRLLPYLYTAIEETAQTGIPLMRPLFLEYPQAAEFYGDDRDFLFGRDLFVAPVTTEMVDAEDIALPPGGWYDFWSGARHEHSEKIQLRPRLDEMPLYVRAGALLPMQPVVQNTGETPDGPLELRVYPGEDCSGSLYEDDGHTFAYQKGEILRIRYSCASSPSALTIASRIEKNAYKPWWNSTALTVYGAVDAPKEVRIGERVTPDWRFDSQTHTVTLTVPDALKNWTVRFAF